MTYRKKLIEVALPLEAINSASAREKSIRHGHPSTLHLWWARRPLAACRAVIFSSLVDDPDSPDALPAFVEACKALPKGANAALDDTPRMRLFDFIERLVTWEATTDEAILNTARELILHRHRGQSAAPARPVRRGRQHPAGGAAAGLGGARQRPEPRRRDDQQGADRNPAALRQYAAGEPARPRADEQRRGLERRCRTRRRRALLRRVDARASVGAHRASVPDAQRRNRDRVAVGADGEMP